MVIALTWFQRQAFQLDLFHSEVSPEDVHPNSEDPVYDGIDQKCDGNE